ncbi:MAG: hypothetical protein JOZ32_07135, partial [Bryobacterales bacterium]|nr:hypothetical protein [Bryobacterales bacterium]
MTQRTFLFMSALAAIAIVPVGSALGQTASQTPSKTGKAWTDPKTPWGTPDLQGTWTSDDT